MQNFISEFSHSLQTGFVNQFIQSNGEYRPEFLINDRVEKKKVLTSIINRLVNCNEFWFSVAFMTSDGVATLINTLEEINSKNIKGKILVSDYLHFTHPEAMRRILQFNNIELRISEERKFHSKGYLFKFENTYDLIIGSSNLTANAFSSNVEWNLKVSATPQSAIIGSAIKEFESEFKIAKKVTHSFIDIYEQTFIRLKNAQRSVLSEVNEKKAEVVPNSMQKDALSNLRQLRLKGKNKYLLISATGTGKTYLSAFDAKNINAKSLLFIVHRANIAQKAMETFSEVFAGTKTMGLYSGDQVNLDKDFVFSTIQTISKDNHLKKFEVNRFEYIIIDESHRAASDSYTKVLDYFKSKYLLGMTATPERTDGQDIFQYYDHNIAYEIRLQKAMEMDMVSPFHYYGIVDIKVNNVLIDENSKFSLLTSKERVKHIISKAKFYGCDNGIVRGLIFCRKSEECFALSKEFNLRGFKTVALDSSSSEKERSDAITALESEDINIKIDYIFTVDIFNEGVDIPKVNQVIMLRPTQSSIIFVQQLGRGLRKTNGKNYLTVLDFIGNYSNNFLIPIALYGDTSFSKDSLRKLISNGSSPIPGSSTVNFDEISRKQIFESIDKSNLQLKKDLIKDFQLLKFKLGRIPSMVDFLEHSARNPRAFVNYSKSYLNFILTVENDFKTDLTSKHKVLLELFSNEIANGKRIVETVILKNLLFKKSISYTVIRDIIHSEFNIEISDETLESCLNNLNFEFVRKNERIITQNKKVFRFEMQFQKLLQNQTFLFYFEDLINYSVLTYRQIFKAKNYRQGFLLYEKYSRKDVCRILNWKFNEESTIYGYKVKNNACPIFVTYKKKEGISKSTQYEDKFISNTEFEWFSRSNRKIKSKEIQSIINYKKGLKLPLFIQKSNDEGHEFYFMGFVNPIDESFSETTIINDKKKKIPIVKILFNMNDPVEDNLYNYITKT